MSTNLRVDTRKIKKYHEKYSTKMDLLKSEVKNAMQSKQTVNIKSVSSVLMLHRYLKEFNAIILDMQDNYFLAKTFTDSGASFKESFLYSDVIAGHYEIYCEGKKFGSECDIKSSDKSEYEKAIW